MRKKLFVSCLFSMVMGVPAFGVVQEGDKHSTKQLWRGLHLINRGTDQSLDTLAGQIPKLAEMGVNVLILEIDYNFEFKSHPELRAGARLITRGGAAKFAAMCKKHGVRLIPEFQSL